jgi:hypothetical protein
MTPERIASQHHDVAGMRRKPAWIGIRDELDRVGAADLRSLTYRA